MTISRRNFVGGLASVAVSVDGRFRGIGRMLQATGAIAKEHLQAVADSTMAVFDGRAGYGTVTGVRNFTDVTLAKRVGTAGSPDQWWMYGAALVDAPAVGINLVSAFLPSGAPLGAAGWTIMTAPSAPGKTGVVPVNATQAAALAPPSPAGKWDVGRHAPCYVRGFDAGANGGKGGWRERLYYAGSATMFGAPYAIGFAEWDGTRWVPQENPCLKAAEPWEHGNVAEPNVVFHEDRWHMWYCAGPDAQMRYAQGYAVSDDGRSWWQRSVFLPAEQEVFDYAVIPANRRLEAVFARGNPNAGHAGERDGLWWRYAATSSPGDVTSWSEPQRIFSVPGAPAWCANAVWKPSFRYDESDPARMWVYFDGAAAGAGGRPVFSVGVTEFRLIRSA